MFDDNINAVIVDFSANTNLSLMTEKFSTILKNVTQLLEDKLPAYLTYHDVKHTLYVVEKAEHIARKEGITRNDLELVKVAALYHDLGFINSHLNHEKEGCEIARQQLVGYGYSKTEIELVCGMIMATQIPQNPKIKLEEIVADADLEYLATNRYHEVSELLYKELQYFNAQLSRKEWIDIQVNFMKKHTYHTAYCKRYKSSMKIKNLNSLE